MVKREEKKVEASEKKVGYVSWTGGQLSATRSFGRLGGLVIGDCCSASSFPGSSFRHGILAVDVPGLLCPITAVCRSVLTPH